ncbi:MAG: FtsX-like permease family protein [Clostridium sp.]
MKGVLYKDTFREIKNSIGRFLSILFIVAIGVAFYVGVKVSSPTMENTADIYFKESNLYDIQVISNLGLDIEDIKEIGKVKGVSLADGRKTKDFLTEYNGMDLTLRVHGEDFSKINNKDYINKPILVEGRLPNNKNECLIDDSKTINIGIGEKIKLQTSSSEEISESLEVEEYIVVGKVMMPTYISHQKGSTTIGSGTLNTFMLIDNRNFKSDIYTECLIKLERSNDFGTYSSEYKRIVKNINKKIELLADKRASLRYNKVIIEGSNKISDGRNKLEDERITVNNKLDDARKKLIESEKLITAGENSIKVQEDNLAAIKVNGNIELDNSFSKIEEKELDLSKKYNEFLLSKPLVEKEIKADKDKVGKLSLEKEDLISIVNVLEEKILDASLTDDEKANILIDINNHKNNIKSIDKNITSLNISIENRTLTLAGSEKGFVQGFESISQGKDKINTERNNLDKKINEYTLKINEAKENIKKNKEKVKEGKVEYNNAREKAESEFAKVEVDLNNAKAKLDDIKEGKWYLLDREANYGIVEYGNSATSINSIAKVFPVFFFFVAALICVTTMTRMIDEQRTTIGTLKAIGYSRLSIMMKYILYSSLASVLGCVLGYIIGISIFPAVIFNAYATMTFTLPDMKLMVSNTTLISGFIIAVGTTLIATSLSCYKELIEMPSLLMRPKPPKNGKRIFIERIEFIWLRLGFIQKVTVRNLFRYKKRFFMTVIGIAGCSALVLSGFGIRDSIGSIVDKQYQEVFKYDGVINYKKEVVSGELNSSIQSILKSNSINIYENVRVKKMEFINSNNVKKEANLFVPENLGSISEFVNLTSRSGEKYKLSNNGVIITEKLSKLLTLKVGDEFSVEDEDKTKHKIIVEGIVENYIDHYVYMSKDLYGKTFNREVKYNQMVFVQNNLDNNNNKSKLTKELTEVSNISSVAYNLAIKETFDSMISNLKYIVLLMIISAGALAFVVLYNLTNVNISERIREIATIKVLGFYDREVSSYVFRENLILTIIGGIVGLLLGVTLHRFIMLTAELDLIMFGRNISFLSYVYSLAITIGFSLIVNGFMYFKLKKIKMVESLKSVE